MAMRITRTTTRLGPAQQAVLLVLLLAAWLLNLADLLLTRHALWRGIAIETNWLMSYFFRQGIVPAVAFKVGIVTVGVLALWRLRAHREALFAAVTITGALALVVTYQITSLLTL